MKLKILCEENLLIAINIKVKTSAHLENSNNDQNGSYEKNIECNKTKTRTGRTNLTAFVVTKYLFLNNKLQRMANK
jgi:hypothetical protein